MQETVFVWAFGGDNLIIQVSAALKAGKLIKGKHEWPICVGFQGNTEVQSFYLHLDERDSFALDNLMQDMLGDAGTDKMSGFEVKDAGIFYVNKPENTQAIKQLVKKIDTEAGDAVASLLADETVRGAMEQGGRLPCNYICMWLTADLRDIRVLHGLAELGYSGGQAQVILVCLYKNEQNFLCKGFFARLPDIKLLNIFAFENVRLKYVISAPDTKTLALAGQVLFSLGENEFTFAGDLTVYDDGYNASLSSVGKQNELAPFTGMVDTLVFENIVLHVSCTRKTEAPHEKTGAYFLSGDVTLAGIKTGGLIYFEQSTITLAEVEMKSDFSLALLWNHIFPGYYLDDGMFDIRFLQGSELYYCEAEQGSDIGERHYEKGFGVRLFTELTLIYTVSLEGILYIGDDSVRAALYSSKAINLGIIRIEGVTKNGIRLPGPGVSFVFGKDDANKKKMFEISGEIVVLNETFTESTVQYCTDGDKWEVRAELTLPERLQQFFCKTFTLVYSGADGFRIEDAGAFPFSHDSLNFAELFNRFMETKKGACETVRLGGKDDKIHLKFNLKPGISGSMSSEADEKDWSVTLTVTGMIQLVGRDEEVLVSREFSPGVSLAVNSGTSFSDLPGMLAEALEEVVLSVINMLFDDANFKELERLLMYLLEDRLADYGAAFLCRKLLSEKNVEQLLKDAAGGDVGPIADEFALGGGMAFGGGDIFENLGYGFLGILSIILLNGGGGGEQNEDDKLPVPGFKGEINGSSLILKIEEVKYAVGYKIDIIWMNPDRRDYIVEYDLSAPAPDISLLDIPVCGEVYIAVRAIHRKPELSGDWTEANLLSEITSYMLVSWAYNQEYCIRDCFTMLKHHDVGIENMEVLGEVLRIYGAPDTPESIAKTHYEAGDAVAVCIKHIEHAYPNMPVRELMGHLCQAGYDRKQIVQALVQLRPELDAETLNAIADNL